MYSLHALAENFVETLLARANLFASWTTRFGRSNAMLAVHFELFVRGTLEDWNTNVIYSSETRFT